MNGDRINEQIIESIREKSENSKAIADFLIDLIYSEAEHPKQWKWKDTYRKKIEKYLKEWGENDED